MIVGLRDFCELTVDECIEEAGDRALEATGVVVDPPARVKRYGDGADASGGSSSSLSEAIDCVVVMDAIVSSDVRCRRCGSRRFLLLRKDLSLAGERWATWGITMG